MDDDLRMWMMTLGTEDQVSTLASLAHTNNNRTLTETIIRFAMALGARGALNIEARAGRSAVLDNLKAKMEEGSWWRA